jgi:hypothetical protein
MAAEEHKALIRRWLEEAFSQGSLAVVDEEFAVGRVTLGAGGPGRG